MRCRRQQTSGVEVYRFVASAALHFGVPDWRGHLPRLGSICRHQRCMLSLALRKAMAQMRFVPRALALVWDASRGLTITMIVLLVVQGLLPAAVIWLSKDVIDAVVALLRAGAASVQSLDAWRGVFAVAATMVALLLSIEIARAAYDWVRATQGRRVAAHVADLVHAQAISLDLAFYDSADHFDRLHRARDEAQYRPLVLLENLGSLVQHGITLVALAALLLPYGVLLSVALVGSTVPALLVLLWYAVKQHHWRRASTAQERRSWYLAWLMTSSEPAAEVRLFGLGPQLRRTYMQIQRVLSLHFRRMETSKALGDMLASACAVAVAAACLLWMLWRAARGEASLGDVALFYQAFNQGQKLMRSVLGSVGQIYQNILFLGNLFEYLDLKPAIPTTDGLRALAVRDVADNPTRARVGVTGMSVSFENVSFRYSGSDRDSLSNLSLDIPAGQVLAVVGMNGAGKSTLLKLLCRLYDPQQGRILVDGRDIRDWPLDELRDCVSALMQSPIQYHATVAENVAIGAARAVANASTTSNASDSLAVASVLGAPVDEVRVRAALRAAGAETLVSRLPKGVDTMLGRWFTDGVNLSGGESQRVALARAFVRAAPIIVLDEPTSAMDSWAEADWMEHFKTLAGGRTVIIVTHRFTTARRAQRICVMRDGRIVEAGSHDELLALGQSYAQSWRNQQASVEADYAGDPVPTS